MAASGLGLVLFVIAHMLGNLQVFLGPEALNAYAAKLQGLGALLWVARLGLLAIFVLHVATAIRLTRQNRAARPVAYAVHKPFQSTYASRTMMMSGLIVLAFAIYHLLHFTFGTVDTDSYARGHQGASPDVYGMMIHAFRQPLVATSYLVAMLLLALHISHGLGSLVQSFGFTNRRTRAWCMSAGRWVAVLIFVGNASMPLAILCGWTGGY
jgi:succinate dehydrogenase / fumarate reductase cytochrome b subunit